MEDEAVGDHLQAHLDREDGREKVVEVIQDLENKSSRFRSVSRDKAVISLTWFLSDFELSGSSAANMAEDTMMQTRTMLPK